MNREPPIPSLISSTSPVWHPARTSMPSDVATAAWPVFDVITAAIVVASLRLLWRRHRPPVAGTSWMSQTLGS